VRNPARAQAAAAEWNVATYADLDDLLGSTGPDFVVVSVPRLVAPELLARLAEHEVPALTETPPAADLAGLLQVWELVERGACIQVAEQYLLQPLHAARSGVVRSGRLGTISQAQVSVAHDYHGMSLLRHFLQVGFEDAAISARRFASPLMEGPTRTGPPAAERLVNSTQVLAQLDFGDRLGIYDFTDDQYFSWIRSPRLLVRGERGELVDRTVRYLVDYRTPVAVDLQRRDTGHGGNLEGYFHVGVLLGSDWVYRNAFAPARLADDEIALAACLAGMANHLAGGPASYPFAQAAQDHYLALAISQAVETGGVVQTERQPWSAGVHQRCH
jgi:predicted dehydrogenase